MTRPGYDDETEQRRLRESDDRPTSVAFLDDVFWAGGGLLVLALPALLVAPIGGYRVGSAAAVGFSIACLTAATLRGGWLDVGPPWPDPSARTLLVRAVWYSLVLAGGAVGGAWLWSIAGPILALGVVAIGTLASIVAVPWLTRLVD